jgi:hypothetical protein
VYSAYVQLLEGDEISRCLAVGVCVVCTCTSSVTTLRTLSRAIMSSILHKLDLYINFSVLSGCCQSLYRYFAHGFAHRSSLERRARLQLRRVNLFEDMDDCGITPGIDSSECIREKCNSNLARFQLEFEH